MLQYSFNLHREAAAVNQAIEAVLNSGRVTPDLELADVPATTTQVGDAVTAHIEQLAEVRRFAGRGSVISALLAWHRSMRRMRPMPPPAGER